MNVRKFVASSARDALRKVKEVLGPDAIILSNRAVSGGVEIMAVAASDMEMMVPHDTRDVREAAPRTDGDYTVRLSTPSPVAPAPQPSVPPTGREQTPPLASRPMPRLDHLSSAKEPGVTPKQAEIVPVEVMDEIRSLRKMVERHLAGFAWGEEARSEPVKTEVLRQLLDAGFSPALARQLLANLPRELNAGQALGWVKLAADRALLTIGNENDIIDRGGIYALVGPTGVGKTTTTAKLAARCVLRHGASKVALITTDGYRIGAHEQLRIYGRILGVNVYLAKDADELQQTLLSLQHKHMVLVDTMGMSQRDQMLAEQIAMFGHSGVKRLLLLAATGRGDTLDDVVRAYGGQDLAGCILSKVDEAASLATALDVVIRHRLPLHYVSNGQRVPEDLHLPNRAYLLHRAFKDQPETSPHRLGGLEPGLMLASSADAVAGGVVAEPYADQAAGLRRLFARERLRVTTFVSGSIDLGKNLLVANLAACLARQGRSVLVIDENTGGRAVASCFGATVRHDLSQVIDGKQAMRDVVVSVAPGVKVLAAAGAVGRLSGLNELQQGVLLSNLCALDEPPDVILVDASPDHPLGFSPLGLAAHDAVIVMAPTPASITEAYALIKKVSLGYARRHYRVLINGVRGTEEGRAVYGNMARVTHARRFARLELAGCVPLDDHLSRAAMMGQPVLDLYPRSPAAKACTALAAALLEWPLPEGAPAGMEQFVQHLLNLSRHIDPVAVYA